MKTLIILGFIISANMALSFTVTSHPKNKNESMIGQTRTTGGGWCQFIELSTDEHWGKAPKGYEFVLPSTIPDTTVRLCDFVLIKAKDRFDYLAALAHRFPRCISFFVDHQSKKIRVSLGPDFVFASKETTESVYVQTAKGVKKLHTKNLYSEFLPLCARDLSKAPQDEKDSIEYKILEFKMKNR